MVQLSEQLLSQITQRLRQSLNPICILLFGSYASNCAGEDSDIDLLIVVPDSDKNTRELAHLGRTSLWGIKMPFDLIVCKKSELDKWSGVACNPIHTAVTQGRLIYESQN